MPIHCQYYANPRSIFLWIFANPWQSMPILANPMPISGQSVTSYVLNHRTSCLYGMVPSLLGGWTWALPIIINSSQSWPVLANQCQSWPIQCQFKATPLSIFHPNQLYLFANPCQFWTIHTNLGQSDVNPEPFTCQSSANQMPSRAIPWTNPESIWSNFANPVPIRCQSLVIFGSNINSPTSKTCQFQLIPAHPCQSIVNFSLQHKF